MITAKFSNGHTDVYKGKRPVKAAWMIVSPDGEIRSGHSLDKAKARKTAEGNMAYLRARPDCIRKMNPRPTVAAMQYFAKLAREHYGFSSYKAAYADGQAKMAAFRATCKIEVIDL